jgi:uncharacterized membrane protein YkvA (DUF1232 family)
MPNTRNIISNQNSGFIRNLLVQVKLILRLIRDPRVNFFVKLLPIAAAIYVISPVDLIPGAVLPFVGALDDAMVVWLGTSLFMALCPEEVVREHTNALENVVTGTWQDAPQQKPDDQIIDIEASDEK